MLYTGPDGFNNTTSIVAEKTCWYVAFQRVAEESRFPERTVKLLTVDDREELTSLAVVSAQDAVTEAEAAVAETAAKLAVETPLVPENEMNDEDRALNEAVSV